MDVVEVSAKDDVVTKEESDSQAENNQSTGDSGVSKAKKDGEDKKDELSQPRVTYSKEELLNLRESPACQLWPSILSESHVRNSVWDPELWHQSFGIKRCMSPAEELKKQQLNVIEDGIVLSPQRQSFVQGCQIPQSAPERGSQQDRSKTGISRTTDREREGRSRLTGRVGRGRALDYKERTPLQERNRDSDEPLGRRSGPSERERDRDERGFKGRERVSERGQRDKEKEQKKSSDYPFRSGKNIQVTKKQTRREKEPEWFTFGPSSQFETMELKGFDEEERDSVKKDKERRRSASDEIKAILSVGKEPLVNGEVGNASPATTSSSPSQDSTSNDTKTAPEEGLAKPGARPFDINQFFLSETLLPFTGGMDQTNSRFCQFFGKPGSNYSSSRSGSAGLSSGGANTPRTPSPGPNYLFTPIAPSGDDDMDSNSLARMLGQTKVSVQPLLDEVMSTAQDSAKIKGSIRLEDIEAEVRKDGSTLEKEIVDVEHNKENIDEVGGGGDVVSKQPGDMLAFNMLVQKMKSSGTLPEKPQPAISGLPTHLLPRPPSPKRKTPRRSPSPLADLLRRSPSPADLLQQLTMQTALLPDRPRPPSPAQVVPQMNRPYSPLEIFQKFNSMVTPPHDLFSSPLLRRSPSPLQLLAHQRQSPPLGFGSGHLHKVSPQSTPLYHTVPQPSMPVRGQQPPRKPPEWHATPGSKSEPNHPEVSSPKPVSAAPSSTPHIIDRSFMPTSVIRKIHQERMDKPVSGDKAQDHGQTKGRAFVGDSAATAPAKSSMFSREHEEGNREQCPPHRGSGGTPPRQPYIGSPGQDPMSPNTSSQAARESGQVFMKGPLFHPFSAENSVSSHHSAMKPDHLLSPRSMMSSETQMLHQESPVLQKPTAFKPLPGSPQFTYSSLKSGVHSEPSSPLHSLAQTSGSPLRQAKTMPHSAPCTPQRHPLVDKALLLSPQQLASRGQMSREETNRQLMGVMGHNGSPLPGAPLESHMQALHNGITQVVAAREGRPLSHAHEQQVRMAANKVHGAEVGASHPKRSESLSGMSSVPHHNPNNIGIQRMNSSDASIRHENLPPNYHSRMHGDNRPIPGHHIPRQFIGSPGPRPGLHHLPNGRMSPSGMPAMQGHPAHTPFNSPMPGMGVPHRPAMHPGMMQPPVHPSYLRMMQSGGPPMGMRGQAAHARMPGTHSAGRYQMMPGQPPMMYGGRPSPGYPAMSPAAMMAGRSPHMPSASGLQQVHGRHAGPSPIMNHPPASHSPGGGNILSKWFSDEVLQQANPGQRSSPVDYTRKVMSVEDLERQQAAAIN